MITPKDGSSLYYSLLWTPAIVKESFLQRLTLIDALATCLDDVQEPSVAEKKIHWWHEELERLAKSTPRHPACKENLRSMGGNQIAIRHCLSILSSAASTRYTQSQTDEEAQNLLLTSFKARLALLSDALNHPASETETETETTEKPDRQDRSSKPMTQYDSWAQYDALALAFAIHEDLYRLPHHLHRGFAVFSDETYERHSMSPEAFASQGSQPLLDEAVNSALTHFDTAFADDATKKAFKSSTQLPLWRLAKLRAAQLQLWQRKATNLTAERSTLTPVRKLYIAWRHRRA